MKKKLDKALFQSFHEDPKGTFEKMGVTLTPAELQNIKEIKTMDQFQSYISKSRFNNFFEF